MRRANCKSRSSDAHAVTSGASVSSREPGFAGAAHSFETPKVEALLNFLLLLLLLAVMMCLRDTEKVVFLLIHLTT